MDNDLPLRRDAAGQMSIRNDDPHYDPFFIDNMFSESEGIPPQSMIDAMNKVRNEAEEQPEPAVMNKPLSRKIIRTKRKKKE